MSFTVTTVLITVALLLGMLLFQEIGRRIGIRRRKQDPTGAHNGTGTMEGSVFALFGLLIAFTFSGAAQRFDGRRQMVVEEANAIGTAYLRLDLLPKEAQPELRELFRTYLHSRLETYKNPPDFAAAKKELAHSNQLQMEIWTKSWAACEKGTTPAAAMLLLPALNQMIDISTTRTMSTQIHPPLVIFGLLLALGLVCALYAGYGMSEGAKRDWIHILTFAGCIAVAVFVILDIEYPRLGLIRVDAIDQVLFDLHETMKQR